MYSDDKLVKRLTNKNPKRVKAQKALNKMPKDQFGDEDLLSEETVEAIKKGLEAAQKGEFKKVQLEDGRWIDSINVESE